MTYREVIYMVNDLCKQFSDDASYTEDHILFLINKYRGALLQQYLSVKKQVPHSNYQTIEIEVTVNNVNSSKYQTVQFTSAKKIPNLLSIGNPSVYTPSYYDDAFFNQFIGPINLVSRERLRYVGYRSRLKNQLYAAINPLDNLLELKVHQALIPKVTDYIHSVQGDVQFVVFLTGVFEDAWAVTQYQNGSIDSEFPLESALLPNLLQAVLKDILGGAYRPKDGSNNANDDLSSLAYFIQKNVKSALAKQLDTE